MKKKLIIGGLANIAPLQFFTVFPEYFISISILYSLVLLSLITYNYYGLTLQKAVCECIAFILFMTCYLLWNDDLITLSFRSFNDSVLNDYLAYISKFIICFFSAVYFLFISNSLKEQKLNVFEYSLVVLFSILGLMLMCSSSDLLTAYLSLELSSLALYILASFRKTSIYSVDSGLKYFIVGAISSSFFLMGSSLLYLHGGSIYFFDLTSVSTLRPEEPYTGVPLIDNYIDKPFYKWWIDFLVDHPEMCRDIAMDLDADVSFKERIFPGLFHLITTHRYPAAITSGVDLYEARHLIWNIHKIRDNPAYLAQTITNNVFFSQIIFPELVHLYTAYDHSAAGEPDEIEVLYLMGLMDFLLENPSLCGTLMQESVFFRDIIFPIWLRINTYSILEPTYIDAHIFPLCVEVIYETFSEFHADWTYKDALLESLTHTIIVPCPVSIDYTVIDLGLVLILFSLFIKLACAPFHLWSLDVYEGSPTSSSFFFAVITKLSIFVLLTRLCYTTFHFAYESWNFFFFMLGIFSVFVGAFGGLKQKKIKTLLAYSSITNMGYALLALGLCTKLGIEMLFFHVVIYLISGLCTWSILLLLRLKTKRLNNKYNKELGDLVLLQKSNPALALAFSLTMFSIAGIPPMIGFLAKMGVFLSLLQGEFYVFVIASAMFSVVATFYYIRIVKVLYFENLSVGKLYYPIKTTKTLILSILICLLLFLFVNPSILYILTCYLAIDMDYDDYKMSLDQVSPSDER